MKPVAINLVLQKDIRGNFFLSFVVILVFSTLGIILVNTIDYYANIKMIKTYELRLKEINHRSQQKRTTAQKKLANKRQSQKIKQDLNYLGGILEKNMFSLPAVLTEIERVKPDKIDITELVFSDDLKGVTIRGESNHVEAVSEFIIGMDRSKRFDIELSKEEINQDKRIIFKLTARWIPIENDQKM